jgi:hypothetical protein
MTTYRAPSGATVFATGSIQWAWGLDDYGAPEHRVSRLNPAAQQVTRNVLERLTTVAPAAPAAPANLTAGLRGQGVDLAWTDRAADEAGYEVERAAGGAFVVVARLGANAQRYTDAAVARRTGYTYRVRAYNAGGNSAYSNTAAIRTK